MHHPVIYYYHGYIRTRVEVVINSSFNEIITLLSKMFVRRLCEASVVRGLTVGQRGRRRGRDGVSERGLRTSADIKGIWPEVRARHFQNISVFLSTQSSTLIPFDAATVF